MLPPRLPKKPKRATRWRSQAHCNFVRGFGCSVEGCKGMPIEVAHVRMGSGAGQGQKPDDWRTVSLCRSCHNVQHTVGERTFWKGRNVETLIEAFIEASPKRADIRREQQVRGQ